MKTHPIVSAAALAISLASGCRAPVPAQPIAVQTVPLPAVSLNDAPVPTAVSGVEVRVAPTTPAANYWSEVAKEGAYGAAPALCKEWKEAGTQPPPAAAPVHAFFASNVPGSNVRIDGVSYGTVGTDPLAVSVTPGLHNLEIAYPGMEPFKDLAMIQEGSSFVTVLAFTDAAAAAAKEDAYFQTVLERAQKSGLTDDLTRELIAKGYAKYLSESHARIEGIPQTIGGNAPSLGLNAVAPAKPVETPTTEELLRKAAELLQ